jgi:eukaryotic-like serine/threonine-protein kinase
LKILDFGLAQWIPTNDQESSAVTITKAQEITGTLPYMAPEQLRGHRADQRTDIYSAGAVIYEMATGKRPHLQTSGPQLISAILERSLAAPSTHNPRITPRSRASSSKHWTKIRIAAINRRANCTSIWTD